MGLPAPERELGPSEESPAPGDYHVERDTWREGPAFTLKVCVSAWTLVVQTDTAEACTFLIAGPMLGCLHISHTVLTSCLLPTPQ